MNYVNDSAALFSGLACWPRPSLSDSLQAGFLASVLISHRPFRSAYTSPAVRGTQILSSSVRKERQQPFPSAVNIALRGFAQMAERLFSNLSSHFQATKSR